MKLEDQLEKFKKEWMGVKVMQHEDKLVYTTAPSFSKRAAKRANDLIEVLGLDLVAIPSTNYPQDSFVVQSLK